MTYFLTDPLLNLDPLIIQRDDSTDSVLNVVNQKICALTTLVKYWSCELCYFNNESIFYPLHVKINLLENHCVLVQTLRGSLFRCLLIWEYNYEIYNKIATLMDMCESFVDFEVPNYKASFNNVH